MTKSKQARRLPPTHATPMITQEQAIARARAIEQGWGLVEPLSVTPRHSWSGKMKSYDVESDPRLRGSKTRFTIDAMNGAILSEGTIAR